MRSFCFAIALRQQRRRAGRPLCYLLLGRENYTAECEKLCSGELGSPNHPTDPFELIFQFLHLSKNTRVRFNPPTSHPAPLARHIVGFHILPTSVDPK